MNKNSKIRILMVTPSLSLCGGIESYVYNYYKNFSEQIEMDFATHQMDDEFYSNEINKRKSSKIYLLKKINIKNLASICKKVENIIISGKYDIVHCNMANAAFIYLYYAKKHGVNVRIIHSHQTNYADKFTHKLRNIPLIYIGKKYANVNFACSKLAGDFLFKEKNYTIINNAIEFNKFKFNKKIREEIRDKEGFKDKDIVLGNIGRFCNQKNQIYLIKLFSEMVKINKNYKLVLIGFGELKEKLIEEVEKNKLNKSVKILNSVNNINEYLQALDLLIMPSLYEGLPLIGVEAQATSLPCLFADTITKEVAIIDKVKFLNLSDNYNTWNDEVKKMVYQDRIDEEEKISASGFNITKEVSKLEELYNTLLTNRLRKTVYIATHKKYRMPENKLYVPIQVGCAFNKKTDYIGDDYKINISEKNKNFCELTGIYNVWKNRKTDIVGLVHYRRYFFKKNNIKELDKIINEDDLNTFFRKYDVILPEKKYIGKYNVMNEYKSNHGTNDLEKCGELIQRLYPEYMEAFNTVMDRKSFYLYNMFITRWKFFDNYSKWLFDILFELEKELDITNYSEYNKRVYGFLSERLFNVWLEKHKNLRIKEIPVNNIEKNEMIDKMKNMIKKVWIR